MQVARQLRIELTARVADGSERADQVIARLAGERNLGGLGMEPSADLGYGTLDIGLRLMALKRTALAEEFFRAAEKHLKQAAERAVVPTERARHLITLARIRAGYLGKIDEAAADLDKAIRLQPENKQLASLRRTILRNQDQPFQTARRN